MDRLIELIGSIVFLSAAKILAGSLIGAVLYRFLKAPLQTRKGILTHPMGLIFFSSLFGVLLPLDSYAVVPIIIGLFACGFKAYEVLPLFLSNSLFSMIVPLTEIGYQWSVGLYRLVFAIVIGFVGGLVIKALGKQGEDAVLYKLIKGLAPKGEGIRELGRFVVISTAGFLVLAVLGGVIYDQYYYNLLSGFKTWFYGTPIGFELAKTLSSLNLFNSFFLVALSIVDVLINPVKLIALLTVFKLRGVVGYYVYFGLWSVLLTVSLVIK